MKRFKLIKMKQAVIAMAILLTVHIAEAQQKYVFTVKEAVEHAIKNVNDIRNLKIDRSIQDAKNKEIRGQALPQWSGTVSLQRFFSIPVTLLPDFVSPAVYGVLEEQGVRDGNGNPIVKPNGPMEFFPAQFGVPWQASAGFSFQQLLFQPDVFVGLQARGTALKYADINIKVMEDSVRSNVYRSYYSVLIAEKRKLFLSEGISRLEKLSSDQEKLFKNGFAEKLDIDKTQVSLNNLKTTLNQIDNLINLGYASLKFALGLNQADTLQLSDVLSEDAVKEGILDASGFTYEDRNEMKLLNTVKELQQLDVKRHRLSYIPTLSAYWNYSQNALRQKFNFFNADQSWFKTSIVGLNISVPLFDGLQKHYRIRQARLTVEKTENNIEYLKKAIDLQRESSMIIFRNALSSLDAQERNMQLAERVFNTTKKKYEAGLGSSFEILQADSEFQTAQSNYFQALFDAVTAKIGYYRSLGKL